MTPRATTSPSEPETPTGHLSIHPARVVERMWSENKYAVMARSHSDYSALRDTLSRGVSSPGELRGLLQPVLRKPENNIGNALAHAYGQIKGFIPDDIRTRIRAAIDTDPDHARETIFRQVLHFGDDGLMQSRLFYSPAYFDRAWIPASGEWYLVHCDEKGNVYARNEDSVREELLEAGKGADNALERVVEYSRSGGGVRWSPRDPFLGEAGVLAPLLLVTHLGPNVYANLSPAVTMLRALRLR